jgi:subtilisin family serine protease
MHSKNFTPGFENKISSNRHSMFNTHSFLRLNLLKFKAISITLFWGLLLFGAGIYSQTTDHSPDRVIVKFRKGADALSIQSLKKDMRASVHRQYRLVKGLQVWRLSGVSVEQIIEQYKNDPSIEYIEPDYLVKAFDTTPNDPYFSELWGMHNTGQTGGTADADIDAPAAWDIETGTDVLIGVIDTGVDYNHVDLAENIWINPGEIPNNNQDDDGNGYIDDIRGWDFVNNDNDPYDDYGHGTHCSGTIAGVGNNGIGVVGVNWHAKILPIKFLDAWGSGTTSDAIAAVEYATRMGVRLTSNSWGGGGYSQGLYDAIEAARDSNQLFIAAAGNDYNDNDIWPTYPCSYDLENIISVAATDHNDLKAPFSNWGATTVDLGAPGVNIFSTTPGNSYESHDGTSMATPHVAGVAGLIWAYVPGLTALQVKNTIMVSTDTITSMENITVTGGRLNVYKALLIAEPDSIPPADILDLAVAETASNWVILSWTASGDDENSGKAAKYDIRYSSSPIDNDNFDAATKATVTIVPKEAGMEESYKVKGLEVLTTYYFAIKVIDEQGNTSHASNSPGTTTLGYPAISYTPSSFIENALTGEQHIQLLNISNTGEGVLDFAFPDFGASTSLGVTGIKGDRISLQLIHPSGQLSRKETHNDSEREMHDIHSSGGESYILFEKFMQPKIQADSAIFYDDMESGTNGWTTELYNGTTDNLWHQTHTTYNSVNTSWWCGIEAQGDYNTGRRISTALISPSINITAFSSPIILQFFEYYDTQYGGDYCMVDISTDEGDSWIPLRGEYGNAPCGYSEGWILTTLDLSAYSGETINLRFYFDTGDGYANYYPGWFIDDVLITASGISWLSLNPPEGSIPTGEDMDVEVVFNASRLYGGTYETDIIMANNDPENSIITIPATFQVTGAPDIDISANNIDYDSVFVDVSKTDSIIIKNLGTDTLIISDIQVTNPVFDLDNSLFSLAPRKSKTMVIAFTPSASAFFSGTLTISSNDQDEPSLEITLQGTGVTPPDIDLSTETLNENLYTGQQAVQTFTINNNITEGSNLIFEIYTMEEEQSSLRIEKLKIKKSGINTLPIKTNNRLTKECYRPANFDLQWKGQAVNLPFYDGFEDGNFNDWTNDYGTGTKEVTDNTAAKGIYSFYYHNITDGHFHGIHQEFPVESQPEYVSFYIRSSSVSNHDAYVVLLDNNFSDIIWFFARGNGYLYVNADVGGDESYAYNANQWYHIEFRDINWVDKNFDYYVDNVLIKEDIPFRNASYADNISSAYLYNYTPGAQAWWDEIRIGGSYTEWLSLDPISGIIPANSTLDIEVTFNAAGMEQGDYNSNIMITSNDPDESEVSIAAHLHVTGAPDIYAETDTLDFGEVFETDTVYLPVVIYNNGTRDLLIRSADTDNPDFTVAPQMAGVDPDETEVFTVRFIPSSLGTITANLTFQNNDPDSSNYIITLTGIGIVPPDISVSPASLSADLFTGQTDIQILNITNESGTDLIWSIGVNYAENSSVLYKSEPFAGQRIVDQNKTITDPVKTRQSDIYTSPLLSELIPAGKVILSQKGIKKSKNRLTGSNFNIQANTLEDILTSLNENFSDIYNSIPNRYNFTEGVTGYYIGDGGDDMYDGGNFLATNIGGYIYYSNNTIASSSYFGSGGRYFTKKDNGLFVLAADINGINFFEISGDLGADGSGDVDGSILQSVINGRTYYGFVKRVYNAYDPSVNHLIIIPENSAASHQFSTNTNNDYHQVYNLSESDRIYYLLYAGTDGYYIDDDATLNIMNTFISSLNLQPPWLTASPSSGVIQAGNTTPVEVIINATGLSGGDYNGEIAVTSNDPDESLINIPADLHVTGAPDISISIDTLKFGNVIQNTTATLQIVVENIGTMDLIISSAQANLPEFSINPNSAGIDPGESQLFTINFTPGSLGSITGILTFTSNDPDSGNYTIIATGTGIEAPQIAVTPDSLNSKLMIGQNETQIVTINNTSTNGTLDFLITIEDLSTGNASLQSKNLLKAKPNMKLLPTMKQSSNSQRLQYPYQNKRKENSSAKTEWNTKFRNLSAGVLFALDYPDLIIELDSHTGTVINSYSLPVNISEGPDGLAFDGRYFYYIDGYNNTIYQIDKSTGETNSITPSISGLIDALAHSGEALYALDYSSYTIYKIDFLSNTIIEQHTFPFEIGGGMTFGGQRGTIFVSSFGGVIREINPSNWQVMNSFSPPQSEEIYGVGYSNSLNILYVAGWSNNLIYALNPDNGTVLFSFPTNIVTALASDEAMSIPWLYVNPISGTIQGQQSQEIEVSFSALYVDAGKYSANIVIASNDPANPEIRIPANLSIKGTPIITTSPDSIHFGKGFIGFNKTDSLMIENTGTDSLIISNIATSDTIFRVEQTSLILLPDQWIKLAIGFTAADTVQYSEYLTIVSNDTLHPELNISLKGYGTYPPSISSSPDSIKAAVNQGDSTSAVLTLGNTGLGPLNWEMLGFTNFNKKTLPSITTKAYEPDATAKQEENIFLKEITANLIDLNDLKIGFTNIGNYNAIISDLTSRGATVEEVTTINNTVLNNLDILALDDQIELFSSEDIVLIRTWLASGKSLLLQADNLNSMSNINELLAGSGILEVYNTYDHSETLTNIISHPVTENVHSVQAILARGYCNVSSPAQSIVLDDSSNTYAAVSSLGSGRLVVVGNEIANSTNIELGDTRLFCNQIFDWLAESGTMISFLPQSGVITHNHTQQVMIKIYAHNLSVQEHHFSINIGSDDPLHGIIQIPLIVTVNQASNITDPYSQIPKTYVLMQNYPNPFNPVTNIRYGLPKAGHVEIVLYNILGQRVVTLVNEHKKAGYHLIYFNANQYASGMYIYRMKSDNFTKVKKMILLK